MAFGDISVYLLYTDTLYNSKILYNVSDICTNVPVYIEFEFITKKFSLTSNYLGPNTIVVKRIDCIVCILTECFYAKSVTHFTRFETW